jgi:hypothetical protein
VLPHHAQGDGGQRAQQLRQARGEALFDLLKEINVSRPINRRTNLLNHLVHKYFAMPYKTK